MAKKKMKRQSKAPSLKRAGTSSPARSRAKTVRKPAAAPEKGLQHMAVGLTANDAAASIKWYCDVLGFSLAELWEKDGTFLGGTVVHGRVAVNIGQDDWKLGRDRKKGQGVRIYVTSADDIDTYARAITSRGGTLEHAPKDDWGFRAFSISDPDGYKITVMRPLK